MIVRAIAYARTSTEETAKDVLTLRRQYDAVVSAIAEHRWEPVAHALDRDIDSSVAPHERPALGRALEDLANDVADLLVVAHVDRISHSALTWAELLERSYKQDWAIFVVEEGINVSSDSGKRAAALLAAATRAERRWLSTRTRSGLAAAQARGTRLGRPVEHSPETRRLVAELRTGGATLKQIAAQLTADGIPTPRGGRWHPSTIHKVLKSDRLDAQAEASRTHSDVEPPRQIPLQSDAQMKDAEEFDRTFPDSYNLAAPPAPHHYGPARTR